MNPRIKDCRYCKFCGTEIYAPTDKDADIKFEYGYCKVCDIPLGTKNIIRLESAGELVEMIVKRIKFKD